MSDEEEDALLDTIRAERRPRSARHKDIVAERIEAVATGDARGRARALLAIAKQPQADERLLAACERLLHDRTTTAFGLPEQIGELRWAAADAVCALRTALGRAVPVIIEDGFVPLSPSGVAALAEQTGVPASNRPGVDGAIETLQRISAAGRLPRARIVREPDR